MDIDRLINRADELLQQAAVVLRHRRTHSVSVETVDVQLYRAFRAASLSFLAVTFGQDHVYYKEFDSVVVENRPRCVSEGTGILKAVRDELAGGWLTSTKGLISGEIFADFLEMAQHLLDEAYKDAAAVIAGSVLEEHLRQLCQKHSIDLAQGGRPKKADTLNAELAKSGVYGKLEQKEVTVWQDLRNNAAHGHYNKYTREQVTMMLQGISSFMTRVPP